MWQILTFQGTLTEYLSLCRRFLYLTTLFPAQGIGCFKSFSTFLTVRAQWVKEIPSFPQIVTGVSAKPFYMLISPVSRRCLTVLQKKTDAKGKVESVIVSHIT